MKKKILIFLIIVIFCFGFLTAKEVRAAIDTDVWGWAWSENIGWISFNSSNCDSNADGSTDQENYSQCSIGDPIAGYAVGIDSGNGLFGGYAWSENIGWISFEDLAGCPAGICEAKIDLGTHEVSGWARAYRAIAPEGQTLGGWDGWIKLGGLVIPAPGDYKVELDSTTGPPNYEFKGWAWGGDVEGNSGEEVVGWISFNDKDFDGSPGPFDYQVMTNLVMVPPNDSPYIESASKGTPKYCMISPMGHIEFSWIYRDKEGDQQSQFNLQVATDQSFSDRVVDYTGNQTLPPGGTGTTGVNIKRTPTGDLDIGYDDSYYWRVKVKAVTEDWSDWAPSSSGEAFTTSSHPWPNPSFTPDPTNPVIEEEVIFIDNSTCYTATESYPCKNDTYGLLSSYGWDFDYPPFGPDESTVGNTVYTYTEADDYSVEDIITVRLQVADDAGMCSVGSTITIGAEKLPLPKWKEVPPF